MYAVIRNYDLFPGTKEEFIQQVQKSLMPIMNQVPGFRAYYLVEVGDNEMAVVSMFETLGDAKASAQKTIAWVTEHTDLFFQGFSKPMAGQVRVQSEAACQSPTRREELLQGCF
jgi:heme-degrading monooxygenase HmoA